MNATVATAEQRKQMARERVSRLVRLRKAGVPIWVIKSEQIALALNRKGMKHMGPGKTPGKLQGELYVKHVCPLLNAAI